jgi:hypothetical protein
MTTRGLLGHVIGKSFVRAGRHDQRIRIHFPVPMDKAKEDRLRAAGELKPGPQLEGGWLVHFDGMTRLHWRLKLLRYYLSYAPQLKAGNKTVFTRRTLARSKQLNAIYEAQGDPDMLTRLSPLIELSTQMVKTLKLNNGILQVNFDPASSARRRVDPSLKFCSQDFDSHLWANHSILITQYALGSVG